MDQGYKMFHVVASAVLLTFSSFCFAVVPNFSGPLDHSIYVLLNQVPGLENFCRTARNDASHSFHTLSQSLPIGGCDTYVSECLLSMFKSPLDHQHLTVSAVFQECVLLSNDSLVPFHQEAMDLPFVQIPIMLDEQRISMIQSVASTLGNVVLEDPFMPDSLKSSSLRVVHSRTIQQLSSVLMVTFERSNCPNCIVEVPTEFCFMGDSSQCYSLRGLLTHIEPGVYRSSLCNEDDDYIRLNFSVELLLYTRI